MLHNPFMGKKRNDKKPAKSDRHKPAKMGRVRYRLAQGLEILAGRRDTDFTEELNRAVRELLEREELWPPPGTDPAP